MKKLAVALACLLPSPLVAQEPRPLTSLPYTPGLDVASMNRAVDPCVDFYQYACGGWLKNNPIPADKSGYSVYGKLQAQEEQFLWGLLEESAKGGRNRTPAQQKVGDYFSSCMDEKAIESAGATPLSRDLAAIAALRSVRDVAGLLGRLHLAQTSSGMFFGFGASQDFKDTEQVIGIAAAGGLGLPDRDYYLKDDAKSVELRRKYEAHVARMLGLLGDPAAAAALRAKRIVEIETSLARPALARVDRRDPQKTYHKMTVGELQALMPHFTWKDYLASSGIATLQQVNVTEPEFFKALDAELGRVSLADWKDYLRWHLLDSRAPDLASKFAEADFDFFSRELRGVQEMPPRWRRCVQGVDRDLGEALGQVFVQKVFGPEVKAATVDMVQRIQQVMERRIAALPWMQEATKKQALEKLHGMRNKIGYPDTWRDYSALEVVEGDYVGNVVRAVTFESRRQYGKIGKPIDRGEWGMTPPTVNAYYHPLMNDMNFPAGILLPPLFDPKIDAAPGYGNTGATVGHELIHGFDDTGRQFDAHGNLRDWWTEEDAKEFEKRVSCVADQYAQYTIVDDIKINSRLTLGEDVADLAGTILAWEAWKDLTKGEDLKPADGLTPEQRFFVGFAQWACGDQRAETKRLSATTNPHSPGEYRINGVVVNMPEFAAAFSCKAGQPMVNENVCRIW